MMLEYMKRKAFEEDWGFGSEEDHPVIDKEKDTTTGKISRKSKIDGWDDI